MPPKDDEIPPAYVEVKADNLNADGELGKQYNAAVTKAMVAAAIKTIKSFPDYLTTQLAPGPKIGYSLAGTVTIEKDGNAAKATSQLQFNNWPKNTLFVMGSGNAKASGGRPEDLATDLAAGLVEDFIKKTIAKFKTEKEKKEKAKK